MFLFERKKRILQILAIVIKFEKQNNETFVCSSYIFMVKESPCLQTIGHNL